MSLAKLKSSRAFTGFDQRRVWRPEVNPQEQREHFVMSTRSGRPEAATMKEKRAAETMFSMYHRRGGPHGLASKVSAY